MHNSTNPRQDSQQFNATQQPVNNGETRRKSKKRIVSYSLDVDLLHKIRKVAQRQDRYYSSIVSEALQRFVQQQLEKENGVS
jgi:hypothetical protein